MIRSKMVILVLWASLVAIGGRIKTGLTGLLVRNGLAKTTGVVEVASTAHAGVVPSTVFLEGYHLTNAGKLKLGLASVTAVASTILVIGGGSAGIAIVTTS